METLRRELEDLEAQLDALEQEEVAPELREELRALAARIDELLAEAPETVPPSRPEGEREVSDRLADLAVRFETEHPALTEVMGRLAGALSRLGI